MSWVSAMVFNKGRSPQNCILADCVSVRLSNAILRDDDVYIAGINFNTRAIVME